MPTSKHGFWNAVKELLPIIVGTAIGCFVGVKTVPTGIDKLSWVIVTTLLGYLTTDKIIAIYRGIEEKQLNRLTQGIRDEFHIKLQEVVNNHIRPLSQLIDRYSPYFAFSTNHGRLESLLRQSENIQSKAKWVVPLFISHKITQDFDSSTKVEFKVNAPGYSDIVEGLLPYATNTIYMTCPHTPVDWFNALLYDDSKALRAATNNTLEDAQFPGHVRAFLSAKVGDAKKRFVILPSGSLGEFFAPQNRMALKCFLRFSNHEYDIDTRFAYRDVLCEGCATPCGLAGTDYQVWDKSAVVEWVDDRLGGGADTSGENTCRLMLNPEYRYLRLFETCFRQYGRTIKSDPLLSLITEIEALPDGESRECWGVRIGKKGLLGAGGHPVAGTPSQGAETNQEVAPVNVVADDDNNAGTQDHPRET